MTWLNISSHGPCWQFQRLWTKKLGKQTETFVVVVVVLFCMWFWVRFKLIFQIVHLSCFMVQVKAPVYHRTLSHSHAHISLVFSFTQIYSHFPAPYFGRWRSVVAVKGRAHWLTHDFYWISGRWIRQLHVLGHGYWLWWWLVDGWTRWS